jgi:hypothetical protein
MVRACRYAGAVSSGIGLDRVMGMKASDNNLRENRNRFLGHEGRFIRDEEGSMPVGSSMLRDFLNRASNSD